MPTRAGGVLLVVGAALLAAGRVLGAVELIVVGAAFALLVVAAVVWVAAVAPALEVGRMLRPSRLHVGDTCTIDLRFRNLARGRSPVVEATDAVGQAVTASVLLGPMAPGAVASVRYRVDAERRGELWVGPMVVSWADPFSLARRRRQLSGHKRVIVLPAVWPIPAPHRARGGDAAPSQVRPDALGRTGDDLYALRRYVAGDDPRRIHWASSARHGDLMVRQAHHPTTSRTTVLLDDTAGWTDHGLDVAASIAASVLLAAHRRGDEVRLVMGVGVDTSYGGGLDHLFAAFERLALATPAPMAERPLAVPRDLDRCALVVVAPDSDRPARSLVALAGANPDLTRVVVHTSSYDPDIGEPDPGRPDLAGAVVVTGRRPFDVAWADALRAGELAGTRS